MTRPTSSTAADHLDDIDDALIDANAGDADAFDAAADRAAAAFNALNRLQSCGPGTILHARYLRAKADAARIFGNYI